MYSTYIHTIHVLLQMLPGLHGAETLGRADGFQAPNSYVYLPLANFTFHSIRPALVELQRQKVGFALIVYLILCSGEESTTFCALAMAQIIQPFQEKHER